MKALSIDSAPEVALKFQQYPSPVREKLEHLRSLIVEVAKEQEVGHLEETLKWGEPSYLAKKGSAIRIDWKEKQPDQYAMYFKCTSKLVPSFQAVFGNTFNFEGTRAIVFPLPGNIPKAELKQCIAAGLQYHKVKDLPNLGL